MSGTTRNPHIDTLLELAAHDEAVLQIPVSAEIFGFHAQQSCEKLLKALISALDRDYPYTHSLGLLIDLLSSFGHTLPLLPFDLLILEPYAVEFRYDYGDPLTDGQKVQIREAVAVLRHFVTEKIPASD